MRQYIGARYVIKIYQNSQDPSSCEWEAGVTYEPLTMVTYQNSSYLSRSDVPATAGDPATSTTYWAQTGYYNGQIAQLQSDVSGLQSDVSGIQGDITSIQGDITSIQGDITSIQGDITSIQGDVTDLQNYGNRTGILVIGNSYVSKGCADKIEGLFKHAYRSLHGGSGFLATAATDTTFEDLLDAAISDSSIINSNITTVLFVSAMGDTRAYNANGSSSYQTGLRSTLSSIMAKISANFTNCNDVCLSLAESRNNVTIISNYTSTYDDIFRVHKIFKDIPNNYGIRYLGWSGFELLFSSLSGAFENDNFHPSVNVGAPVIGEWIKNSFLGHVEYKTIGGTNTNRHVDYTDDTKCTVITRLTPDVAFFEMRYIQDTNGATVTQPGHEKFYNFSDSSIPLPPPASNIDIIGRFVNYNSSPFDVEESAKLTLTNDGNGVLQIDFSSTPNLSTWRATLAINEFAGYSYLI